MFLTKSKHLLFFVFTLLTTLLTGTTQSEESIQILDLDIISYHDFSKGDPDTIEQLKKALFEKGIVGLKGVPNYKETASEFIAAAREFAKLSEETKEQYAPNREKADLFLGYEIGKEKFLNQNGEWIVEDSKASYYAFYPDTSQNIWPRETNLRSAYLEISKTLLEQSLSVMKAAGLMDFPLKLKEEEIISVGRMLHYQKQSDISMKNPNWCGAHFDHGLFTALLPATYYQNGQLVSEPIEAGLYVRDKTDHQLKKIIANDPDVLLFQVGEFGQLASNDTITATEHLVKKAYGEIERFTFAFFIAPSMQTTIHSKSVLTGDSRYGGKAGDPCTYQHWHEATFQRFLHKQ